MVGIPPSARRFLLSRISQRRRQTHVDTFIWLLLVASKNTHILVTMASVAGAATNTVFSRLKSIPKSYPLAFGIVFSGCKTSFSDLLVQKVVERREKVDWRRNAAFAGFGFFYLGGVQYALYVPIFSRLFPGAAAFALKPLRAKLKDAKGMFQVRTVS
jgi:hypothetical protein